MVYWFNDLRGKKRKGIISRNRKKKRKSRKWSEI